MNGFDRVARPYRFLEKIVFGSILQDTRELGLGAMPQRGRILLLGDGDGRFLEAILRDRPELEVVSIDGSQEMLDLAAGRARGIRGGSGRVKFLCGDVPELLSQELFTGTFDGVVTQFFLDCFSEEVLSQWIPLVRQMLAHEGQWVIAEFAVPPSPLWWRALSRALLWIMYRFFRIATGLRSSTLPDHSAAMKRAGFVLAAEETKLAGLLRSERWHSCS